MAVKAAAAKAIFKKRIIDKLNAVAEHLLAHFILQEGRSARNRGTGNRIALRGAHVASCAAVDLVELCHLWVQCGLM